jgi:hypothetical protein
MEQLMATAAIAEALIRNAVKHMHEERTASTAEAVRRVNQRGSGGCGWNHTCRASTNCAK